MYQSNNFILDMNNVVDYLEFKIETHVRGHINSSSAPCDYHESFLLPFSTQEEIDALLLQHLFESMIVQMSPKAFGVNARRSKCSLFRSAGVNSLSTVFATAYSILLGKLTVIFVCIVF